jgi:hypothetical protein
MAQQLRCNEAAILRRFRINSALVPQRFRSNIVTIRSHIAVICNDSAAI